MKNEKSFIVGDAGSSNTQWIIVNQQDIKQIKTSGFNPYTHSLNKFKETISQSLPKESFSNVYLYVAGADTKEMNQHISKELFECFGVKPIVENDLLGAARALCEKEKGYVCILGTGSNASFYDGNSVLNITTSLGYVLGDEGSGAYLSKQLLQSIFRKTISSSLVSNFWEKYSITLSQILYKIYNEPCPNRYLASFVSFLSMNKDHEQVYQIIYHGFMDFFKAFFQDKHKDEYPLNFSGSVAYYFSDILKQAAIDSGYFIKRIVQSPIEGLTLYHQKYG